jgi:GT2 family glycosyltransferase
MSSVPTPRVSAVVLAYGPEPMLVDCVEALLASRGVDCDVVLVDNGCTTDAVEQLGDRAGVTVLRPGHNTGFAGGCNLGADHATAPVLALVNGDAIVRPDALAVLAAALDDRAVGLVTGSVRLLDRPEVVNAAGNPLHFLGLSWAGGLGDPATQHQAARDVASASGAAMACRRETWQALGGFWEEMFAYCEDAELSLRCWQRGWAVRYVPEAFVLHRYEFSRNPLKLYLLERNRLVMLLTCYEARTLALLALPLVALEVALLAVALRQGWWREKVRGWSWLLRHGRVLRERRREVQSARRRGDAALAALLEGRFAPGEELGLHPPPILDRAAAAYWALVRRLL